MSELSKETKQLLSNARTGLSPADEDRTAVRSAVMARVAGAAALGAATTAATRVAAGAGSGGAVKLLAAKIVAGLFAAAAVFGGSYYLVAKPDAPPRTTSVLAAQVPSAPTSIEPVVAPDVASEADHEEAKPASSQPKTTVAAAPRMTSSAPLAPPDLRKESRALAEVQRALRDGKSDEALALIERQCSEYKAGALGEERAAVRVYALCSAGRRAEGQAAAQRFLVRYPRSPLADRVRGACVEKDK